ncbi:MAG: hypothetical protein P8O16_18790 [Algoriphagus sp.]|uniref:hypothetical protein n=1 Tax=Algoriphagus sp. TaxID=1872435 RepID=UPI00260A9CC6|nr:hypothetical protein [Algoriphagus sp.]MDG1279332.1 hypothetical protein [Algoriphagus sp.]
MNWLERLYDLPFGLIWIILLVQFFDLFPVPSWLLGIAIIWGLIAFLYRGLKARKKKV